MDESIRNAMLKACPGCRVGIAPFGKLVSLTWANGTGLHRTMILASCLVIGSAEFMHALESAEVAMRW